METELEFQWLTSLLTGRSTSGLAEPDWDRFTRLALFHRVVPLLPQIDDFQPRIRRNLLRAMQLAGHLHSLKASFAEADARFLVLKGLTLAESLYGGIGVRATGDIDLWIDEETLSAVHEKLLATGHVPKTGYASLSPRYQQLYRERKFHIGYTHEQSGISVEIHWRIGATPQLYPPSFRQAYDRGKSVTIAKSEFQTLGDLDNLLFLHIHAARHLWERLFWLWDLVVFHRTSSAPTLEEVIEQALEWGVARPVLAGLSVADRCLAIDLHDDASRKATALDPGLEWIVQAGCQQLTKPLEELGRVSSVQSFVANWRMHQGFPHRKAVLSEWLSAPDDWHRLKLPDGLGLLYPLARPVTWSLRRSSRKQ